MSVFGDVWGGIGGDEDALSRLGPPPTPTGALPSSFAVESLAQAAFVAVGLAMAELTGAAEIALDPAGIADAVRSEQAVRIGDEPPESVWDPLSRIYSAREGWVRLHGNYRQHRAAIEEAFGTDAPDAVAAAIHDAAATSIETRVIAAGGAAAAAHTLAEWADHPHGSQVADHPLVETTVRSDGRAARWQPGSWVDTPLAEGADPRPLAGLRVLELTRVIAGPVAGRTLSWFGADVVRIESAGHRELRTLVADTGPDKRSVTLDLRRTDDRGQLESLVAGADVMLHGLRPGALDGLGLGSKRLVALAPGLIDASISAYGAGPWSARRGFDSLTQLSTGLGIAEAEAADTLVMGPRALPCQILDHVTGLLVAAAILRAVSKRAADGRGRTIAASLARTAAQLVAIPRTDLGATPATPPAPGSLRLHGPLGTTQHVPFPVTIGGIAGGWRRGSSNPGGDTAGWLPTPH